MIEHFTFSSNSFNVKIISAGSNWAWAPPGHPDCLLLLMLAPTPATGVMALSKCDTNVEFYLYWWLPSGASLDSTEDVGCNAMNVAVFRLFPDERCDEGFYPKSASLHKCRKLSSLPLWQCQCVGAWLWQFSSEKVASWAPHYYMSLFHSSNTFTGYIIICTFSILLRRYIFIVELFIKVRQYLDTQYTGIWTVAALEKIARKYVASKYSDITIDNRKPEDI